MKHTKNIILALALAIINGAGFASQKPTKKKSTERMELTYDITTPFDKEILEAEKRLNVLLGQQESVEFPVVGNKIMDLLNKRIRELTILLNQTQNPIERMAIKAGIDADDAKLGSINQGITLYDLHKKATAKTNTPSHSSTLAHTRLLELILDEQKKMVAKSEKTFLEPATIDTLAAECTAIKTQKPEAVHKEHQEVLTPPEEKKFKENYDRFMDLIQTDNAKEIQECINTFLALNPVFFTKEKGDGITMLMFIMTPSKKATARALSLVAAHSNVNALNMGGNGALHIAIRNLNKEHVQALLDAGASVDIGLDRNQTPFIAALAAKNEEITRIILAKVIMLKDLIVKHNHLLAAVKSIKVEDRDEYNERWTKIVGKLGKNILEKELTSFKSSLPSAAVPRTMDPDRADMSEISLPATALTQLTEKQKIKEQKAADEQKKENAKKEKRREQRERAQERHRASELTAQMALQRSPYDALAQHLSTGGSGSATAAARAADCSMGKEEGEEVLEVKKRKEQARLERKQRKTNLTLPACAAPAASAKSLANLSRLRAHLNPLLRPHLLAKRYEAPAHIAGYHPSQYAPLNEITAFLGDMSNLG